MPQDKNRPCKPLTRTKKIVLISTGTVCLGLAALGVVLPLLPTTPFLLITSACYIRSSDTLYNKVRNSRFFQQYMDGIISGKRFPSMLRWGLVLFVWVLMLALFFFVLENPYLKGLAIFLAAAKTVFMFFYKRRS